MDSILLAGGTPNSEDPLYSLAQGRPRALIEVADRPMVEWMLDALRQAKTVGQIVVAGLDREAIRDAGGVSAFIPDQGSLLSNALAGIDQLASTNKPTDLIMLASADIPCVNGQIIDAHVAQCQPLGRALYYPFVTRSTMERRFPGANRTYTHLKDVTVAGGDLVIAQLGLGRSRLELWQAFIGARKHPWQIARLVGLRTLLKLLTRQLSISEIEKLAQRLIDAPARVVISPHAELAMDADKPHQFVLLEQHLLASAAID